MNLATLSKELSNTLEIRHQYENLIYGLNMLETVKEKITGALFDILNLGRKNGKEYAILDKKIYKLKTLTENYDSLSDREPSSFTVEYIK